MTCLDAGIRQPRYVAAATVQVGGVKLTLPKVPTAPFITPNFWHVEQRARSRKSDIGQSQLPRHDCVWERAPLPLLLSLERHADRRLEIAHPCPGRKERRGPPREPEGLVHRTHLSHCSSIRHEMNETRLFACIERIACIRHILIHQACETRSACLCAWSATGVSSHYLFYSPKKCDEISAMTVDISSYWYTARLYVCGGARYLFRAQHQGDCDVLILVPRARNKTLQPNGMKQRRGDAGGKRHARHCRGEGLGFNATI